MNIFYSIWHHIGLGILSVLVAANIVSPVTVASSSAAIPLVVQSPSQSSTTAATYNFDPTSIGATPVSKQKTPPTSPRTVPTPASFVPDPPREDPTIKIARCQAVRDADLNAYVSLANQELKQQAGVLAQDLDQKRIATISGYENDMLSHMNAPNDASNRAVSSNQQGAFAPVEGSIASQMAVENLSLQSMNSTMQVITTGANNIYQEHYDQGYANLQNYYQAMIDAHTQSLSDAYIKCLGN